MVTSPPVSDTPSIQTLNPRDQLPSPIRPEEVVSSKPEVKVPLESGKSECDKEEELKPKENPDISEDIKRLVPSVSPSCFEFAFDDDEEMRLAMEESLKSQVSRSWG